MLGSIGSGREAECSLEYNLGMTDSNTIVIHGETLVVAGGLTLFFILVAWHVGVHFWREGQQRRCMDQVNKLWSFVLSITHRYIQLAERFAKQFPEHRKETTEEIESLIKLLRALQDDAPAGVKVEANEVNITGDVIGHDKIQR